MDDMVERVARAQWAAMVAQAHEIAMPVPEDTFDSLHPDDQVRARSIARAAIAAMREPTEKMLSAGDSMMPQIVPGQDITTGRDALADAWPAMIDAALGPAQGTDSSAKPL